MTNYDDSKNVEMIKLLEGIYSELKKLNNSMDEFTKKPGEQEKAGISDILYEIEKNADTIVCNLA